MKLFLPLLILTASLYGDVFSKGRTNVGIYVGGGESFGHTYSVVGVNGEYCIVDNFAVGAGYKLWFGSGPTQNDFTTFATYHADFGSDYSPYLGVFMRHTFIADDELDDYSSIGSRIGINIILGRNSYLAAGYVMELYECGAGEWCSLEYPEVIMGVSF